MQIMETLQLDKGELLRRTGATELLSGVGLNHTFGTTSEGFTPPRFGAGSKRATPPITAESFTATTGLQEPQRRRTTSHSAVEAMTRQQSCMMATRQ
jgi:hypothetical protein